MSVGHVLLGVLAEGPAHGYDLKHAHDERYPGAKQLAFGQVYAALAKLEKDGLVEVVETTRGSGPDRTTYALTPLGKAALSSWVSEVEPAGPYAADELVRKTVTALRLGRDAADYLAGQRQAHLAEMRRLVALQESTDEVEARVVIDHAVEHLDADLRWLSNAAVRVQSAGRRTRRSTDSAPNLEGDAQESSNRKVVR
ncbi:MAG: PadR family transcriptional regulator [Actinomycetota bacterium]|nr:PadR family transcriptional regulator [Actinomycetota bacterium]